MITKIISGGQTGVDQAALKIATEMEIPTGGWCPNGGLDKMGSSPYYRQRLSEVRTRHLILHV